MEREIFIQYKFNSQIDDSAFKKQLEEEYKVQTKPIWIPSATDGGEMWFQIFLNIDFVDFMKGAIVGGLAWDLIKIGAKKYFFKPFVAAVGKLIEDNKEISSIDFKRMEFEFNDVTIRILGISTGHLSKISLIFQEIVKVFPRIEEKKLGTLSDIVLPMIESAGRYKLADEITDLSEPSAYLQFWLLEFQLGLDRYIYDVQNDIIIE